MRSDWEGGAHQGNQGLLTSAALLKPRISASSSSSSAGAAGRAEQLERKRGWRERGGEPFLSPP